MRTEVKAGLVVGLVVIGGVAFYLFNRGGAGQEEPHIPWNIKTDQASDTDRISTPGQRTPDRRWTTPVDAADASPDRTPRVPPSNGRRSDERVAQGQRTGVTLPSAQRQPAGSPAAGPRPVATAPASTQTAQPAPAAPTTQPAVATPPIRQEQPRAEDRATRVRDAAKPPPPPNRYTVQRGDTLSSIAREHYGETRYWTRIRDANPDIEDANVLKIGQVLVLPPKEGPAQAEPTAGQHPTAGRATYVVEQGDTLTSIARNVLGDGRRWREIYELNRDRIADPDKVLVGTELHMPPVEQRNVPPTRP